MRLATLPHETLQATVRIGKGKEEGDKCFRESSQLCKRREIMKMMDENRLDNLTVSEMDVKCKGEWDVKGKKGGNRAKAKREQFWTDVCECVELFEMVKSMIGYILVDRKLIKNTSNVSVQRGMGVAYRVIFC